LQPTRARATVPGMGLLDLALISLGGFLAGLVGALMGLGGGLVAVPFVNLVLGWPMQVAAAAGLVSTLATSATAASRFLCRGGLVQVERGLELALAASLGSLAGGLASGWLRGPLLQLVFAGVLAFAALQIGHAVRHPRPEAPGGDCPAVRPGRRAWALGLSLGAGVLSGLLGIGGGMMYVPILHLLLCVPFKASSATSNFLMGLIVLPALGAHAAHGHVEIGLVGPLAAGVLLGASLGAWLMPKVRTSWLQVVFALLLLGTALQLVRQGVRAW